MDQIYTNEGNAYEPDPETPSSQNDSISTFPAAPQTTSKQIKKRQKQQLKRGSEDPIDVQLMKTVNDALANKSEDSSHDIFCKYVASEFKKLSVGAQDFLTMEINNAICKAKRFDRENQQPNLYRTENQQPIFSRFTQPYPRNLEPSYQQPNSPVYNQSYVQHTPRKTYNPQYSFHRSPLQALSHEEPPIQNQLDNNEFQRSSSGAESLSLPMM